jgi:hypothetical protein
VPIKIKEILLEINKPAGFFIHPLLGFQASKLSCVGISFISSPTVFATYTVQFFKYISSKASETTLLGVQSLELFEDTKTTKLEKNKTQNATVATGKYI